MNCSAPKCSDERLTGEKYCHRHLFTFMNVVDNEGGVLLVREWCIKCVMCGRYKLARGTENQARMTALLLTAKCNQCGGNLELEDEGRVVGRIKADTFENY